MSIKVKVGQTKNIRIVAAAEKKPLIVPDTQSDKRFSKKVDDVSSFRTRSIIALPIHYKGRITGVLEVLNIRDPHTFGSKDIEMLNVVADQIGIALENARLYERLKEKFTLTKNELKESQAKLIRSERLAALGQLSQGVAHAGGYPVQRTYRPDPQPYYRRISRRIIRQNRQYHRSRVDRQLRCRGESHPG